MENQTENQGAFQDPKLPTFDPNQGREVTKSFFQSNTARIIMIGALTLALLIPLLFVQNLIYERSTRKGQVVAEVNSLWGADVQFYGPALKIPYSTIIVSTQVDEKTGKTTILKQPGVEYFYLFPEVLNNHSDVKMNHSLKRGIYNPMVFTTHMKFDGNFSKIDLSKYMPEIQNIHWNEATIVIQTTNLKSIKSELKFNIGEQTLNLESKDLSDSSYGLLETD